MAVSKKATKRAKRGGGEFVQTSIRIPKALWTALKVGAAERDLSVQEAVSIALEREYQS